MTAAESNADLWSALEAYLAQRRALGFQLVEEERHARRFLEWLQANGHTSASFTLAQALSWAHGDGSFKNSYQCQRLSAIRGLARYSHAIGTVLVTPRRRPYEHVTRRYPQNTPLSEPNTPSRVTRRFGLCHHPANR